MFIGLMRLMVLMGLIELMRLMWLIMAANVYGGSKVILFLLYYAKQKTVPKRICFDTVVHIACGFMV
jgi:hypothetical protein